MANLTITPQDEGKTFDVNLGDTIVIDLIENPTTGYRWAIAQIDEQILELQRSDFLAPVEVELRVGVGGVRSLTFQARASGVVNLQLHESRPWKSDKPHQQLKVTIRVQ